jgi:hypothetical protein
VLPCLHYRGEHQESHGTGENGTVKGIDERKGEPMNHDTSKTSRTAAPLDVKPDLVKRIGNTTFDIHIHFSETSRETFTDKVVRLIENDKDSVTN